MTTMRAQFIARPLLPRRLLSWTLGGVSFVALANPTCDCPIAKRHSNARAAEDFFIAHAHSRPLHLPLRHQALPPHYSCAQNVLAQAAVAAHLSSCAVWFAPPQRPMPQTPVAWCLCSAAVTHAGHCPLHMHVSQLYAPSSMMPTSRTSIFLRFGRQCRPPSGAHTSIVVARSSCRHRNHCQLLQRRRVRRPQPRISCAWRRLCLNSRPQTGHSVSSLFCQGGTVISIPPCLFLIARRSRLCAHKTSVREFVPI